jgi:hypothetical protein
VTYNDLQMSEVIQAEALINLLDRQRINIKTGTSGGDEGGRGALSAMNA